MVLWCAMFSKKLWLVVIANTLLLQRCIADDALSTVKTSSGRSLYSSVESQNSSIEITPDSFSKSDSSFAASQSEISQNESSLINTDNGTSLQDSSFYSSNNNVSSSNSNTVASDGFISQTDSNFEASSSTTVESDTSFMTTPNSTVMSSTKSSSVSTTSSSSVTSSSVSGGVLGSSEADISSPDDFPPFGSSYETKSLDSITDFDANSLESNQFLDSQKPNFPPSLGFKPFEASPHSKLPPNFPKFRNSPMNDSLKKSGPKGPYIPAGSFNSKPTPKIGTPVGPAGLSTSFLPHAEDNPFNGPDISAPFSSVSNSPINSHVDSRFHEPLPAGSLPNNLFQNNDLSAKEPFHQPFTNNEDLNSVSNFEQSLVDDNTTQLYDSHSLHDNLVQNDISSLNPKSLTTSDLPYTSNDLPSSDLANLMNGDTSSNSSLQSIDSHESLIHFPENDLLTESHPNTFSHTPEIEDSFIDLHPSPPYDSVVKFSENDIPIEFHPVTETDIPINIHPNTENGMPIVFHPELQTQFSELPDSSTNLHPFSPNHSTDSINDALKDYVSDSSITPESSLPSTDLPTNIDSATAVYPLANDATITSPYDTVSDHFGDTDSSFAHLQSQQPYDILKNSPANGEDSLTPVIPHNTYPHLDLPLTTTDQNSTPTLVLMDTNQDGFISPEEILESNNPSSAPQFTIPDLPYHPILGNDDSSILPDHKEYLNSEKFSPNDELSVPLSQQHNSGYFNPQKSPYDQIVTQKETIKPKPLPLYPGFNKPFLGYPGNESLFPNNNYPLPNRSPHFRKYPYLPHFRNDLLYPPTPLPPKYQFPYGAPMKPLPYYDYPRHNPLFYDYTRNYLQSSPLLDHPAMPRPLYPRGSAFNSPHRPHYVSKKWSKIPAPKGSQSSPDVPLPISHADLDSPLLNRPLYPGGSAFNSPNRPRYVPKNWSKISAPKGSQFPPDVLLQSSSADLDSLSGNQPILDLPSESLLPQSSFNSLIPDSSLVQQSLPLDFNGDSPFVPDSLPSNDSRFAILDSSLSLPLNNESPFATLESSSYQNTDLNTNLPLATLDIPSILPTPNGIDDEIFDILKQQYENTIAEYQLSNSIYPQDISLNFDTMTDEELTFNFVLLGSSPAALSALKTLSDTGKSILIVERGNLPPHISKSLYYRPKILQSDYVRRIKSSAPHCSAEKILYAPNVLGEESTYDSNVWDYGVRSKYMKWGRLSQKWAWNNILQYFTDNSDQPYTYGIPVSTEIENTKAVNTITNIFNDAGLYKTNYEKGKRSEGLTVVPYLHENGENIILAQKIFQQLTSCSNLQLALGTIPESIVFDDIGKAIGVVVKTPRGITKTISILDELIIGSNPVDTVQFLYQSGIGDHERLQLLNIPTQINLPYVGKELIITPLHFGVIYLFPQGTLLTDYESDFVGKDYLFGKYGLPSALAVDYFKAALNIYEAREANVVFNFRVFSKSMSERLNSYIARLTHIDPKIKEFLTNLCKEYDLLLAVPQLTNVLSRGEIVIDNLNGEFEALVDTGMYKSKRDITIMQKALKVLKSIAETETFKLMNGQVVQIPVEQCGQPDFSTEYNRCSIRYLSLPNLHYCGGTIMGVSPLTSVVNEDLLVHGTKNVRIFSTSVVPYGTSTDSSAVSSMIGNLGAHIISRNYSL